jgi:hypothetical protein
MQSTLYASLPNICQLEAAFHRQKDYRATALPNDLRRYVAAEL